MLLSPPASSANYQPSIHIHPSILSSSHINKNNQKSDSDCLPLHTTTTDDSTTTKMDYQTKENNKLGKCGQHMKGKIAKKMNEMIKLKKWKTQFNPQKVNTNYLYFSKYILYIHQIKA